MNSILCQQYDALEDATVIMSTTSLLFHHVVLVWRNQWFRLADRPLGDGQTPQEVLRLGCGTRPGLQKVANAKSDDRGGALNIKRIIYWGIRDQTHMYLSTILWVYLLYLMQYFPRFRAWSHCRVSPVEYLVQMKSRTSLRGWIQLLILRLPMFDP